MFIQIEEWNYVNICGFQYLKEVQIAFLVEAFGIVTMSIHFSSEGLSHLYATVDRSNKSFKLASPPKHVYSEDADMAENPSIEDSRKKIPGASAHSRISYNLAKAIEIDKKDSGLDIQQKCDDELYDDIKGAKMLSIENGDKEVSKEKSTILTNSSSLLTSSRLTDENTCVGPKQKERSTRFKYDRIVNLFFQIGCFMLLLALVAIVAAEYVEIIHLKQLRSDANKEFNGTLQYIIKESLQETSMNNVNNTDIVNVFKNINSTFSCQDLFNNLLGAYEKQNMIQLDINHSPCADIHNRNPSSPSGYYHVISNCTKTKLVYCDMSLTCGGITGGWMRIAQLDPQHCPTGFTNPSFNNGTQTCIPQNQSSGCTSVSFNTSGIPYSKVCGRIRGYGIGTVDGFYENGLIRGSSVEDNYLDGVSITSSRTHIWSFVAGGCNRACILEHRLGFVGDDFSCESSGCSSDNTCASSLWDQDDCRVAMPFFFKTLSTSTSADVTMSVCRDETRDNEDIALTVAELYVY